MDPWKITFEEHTGNKAIICVELSGNTLTVTLTFDPPIEGKSNALYAHLASDYVHNILDKF